MFLLSVFCNVFELELKVQREIINLNKYGT